MEADEHAGNMVPWAAKLAAPNYAFDSKDVCKYSNSSSALRAPQSVSNLALSKRMPGVKVNASSKGSLFSAPSPPLKSAEQDRLTEEELRWMGSLSDYSVAQIVGGRPEWIVVPVRDSGAVVGDRIIGTPPGIKYALCIQRPLSRMKNSDVMRIMELHCAIEQSVSYLRKREIFKELRHRATLKLKDTLEKMSKRADLDLQLMFKKLANTLMKCIPGAQICTAVLNVDFNSITYSLFDAAGGSSDDGDVKTATLWLGQGSDWTSVGRKAKMTSFKTLSDVDKNGRKFVCFKPFNHCSFPRYTVPLQSGDVSLGLFGVENFDIYQAGIMKKDLESASQQTGLYDDEPKGKIENHSFLDLLSNPIGLNREIREMNDWLQATAGMCGEVMYAARERHAINELELYVQLSSSTPTGLMRRMLNSCLSVLQGCRMVELWAIREVIQDHRPPIVSRASTATSAALKVMQRKPLLKSDNSDSDEENEQQNRKGLDTRGPKSSERLPTYDPNVETPTEYDITSLAVQTPRPPPEPGRRLRLVNIKLIFDPIKKSEKKKLLIIDSKREASTAEGGNKIDEGPGEKKATGFGAALKRRFGGDGPKDNRDNVDVSIEPASIAVAEENDIDHDEEPEIYASANATRDRVPTKYILGIDYADIEQCCLLNCAADIPEDKHVDQSTEGNAPVANTSRKIQTRAEMLSEKNLFQVTAKAAKTPKKNAYLLAATQSKKFDAAELRKEAEQRRIEYKRQQERQRLLKHTYLCEDTPIVLGSDRDFKLVVYEVTEDMKIVNEFRGHVQLVTFKEASFKCKLEALRDRLDDNIPAGFFILTMDVVWMLRSELDGGHSGVVGSDNAWKNKVCTLHLSSGDNMKKTDVMGSADPFCEVFMNGNFISRTSVQKDTLNPVWNEDITLPPFTSHTDVCTIDVYDMNRLGKGSFMGQVELTMDQLLYPPVRDIRIPLTMKPEMPSKKQLYVGGFLSLRYSIADATYSHIIAAAKNGIRQPSQQKDDGGDIRKRSPSPSSPGVQRNEPDDSKPSLSPTTPKKNLQSVPLLVACACPFAEQEACLEPEKFWAPYRPLM